MSVEGTDNNESVKPDEVMESIGENAEAMKEAENASTEHGTSNNTTSQGDPLYVQKRLKQQTRQHEREMRDMQSQMAMLQAQLQSGQHSQNGNANSNIPVDGTDDTIQKAVNLALSHRDMQERQAKDAESRAYIASKERDLERHLDAMEDKYPDYKDEVRDNQNLPFTSNMKAYALTLPTKGEGSAGEVFYHLAKNPEELKRISRLHPLDQGAEMTKLSQALISGSENKASQSRAPMGNIKSLPVSNSSSITEKTPVSQIAALMRSGKF